MKSDVDLIVELNSKITDQTSIQTWILHSTSSEI